MHRVVTHICALLMLFPPFLVVQMSTTITPSVAPVPQTITNHHQQQRRRRTKTHGGDSLAFQTSAVLKQTEHRQAVSSFRKHCRSSSSIGTVEGLLPPSRDSTTLPSETVPSAQLLAASMDTSFLISELQRAHEEIKRQEQNLHTAARLGEQLILYNEELEQMLEQVQSADLEEEKEEEEEDALSTALSSTAAPALTAADALPSVPESVFLRERASTALLKKRLVGVTKHLDDSEQSNEHLHAEVLLLEKKVSKYSNRLVAALEENDQIKQKFNLASSSRGGTPSPPTAPDQTTTKNKLEQQERHDQAMQALEQQLIALRLDLRTQKKLNQENENSKTQMITAQEEKQMLVDELNQQFVMLSKECKSWQQVASQKENEIDELKNILQSSRGASRRQSIGGRRASMATNSNTGIYRHRLSSSLDKIDQERKIVVHVDSDRFSRPSQNDPWLSYTDYRRLLL